MPACLAIGVVALPESIVRPDGRSGHLASVAPSAQAGLGLVSTRYLCVKQREIGSQESTGFSADRAGVLSDDLDLRLRCRVCGHRHIPRATTPCRSVKGFKFIDCCGHPRFGFAAAVLCWRLHQASLLVMQHLPSSIAHSPSRRNSAQGSPDRDVGLASRAAGRFGNANSNPIRRVRSLDAVGKRTL